MTKQLLSLAAALFCVSASAQYVGVPFYEERFDTQEAIDNWTIENEVSPAASPSWHFDTLDDKNSNYNKVDDTSTGSLAFGLAEGDHMQSTITSPVISTAGRNGLIVGFSIYDPRSVWPANGIVITCEVKAVDSKEWTTIYESNAQGDRLENSWQAISSMLGAEFNGKDIQIRFRADTSGSSSTRETFTAFDGVCVSQRSAIDVEAISVFPNEAGAYGAAETISLTLKGKGYEALYNLPVSYQINGGEIVTETFAGPVAMDVETTYNFAQRADLSKVGGNYELKAWVAMDGDVDTSNDQVVESVTNSIAIPPYKPDFMAEDEWGLMPFEDYWTPLEDVASGRSWRNAYNADRTAGAWEIVTSAESDLNAYLISRPFGLENTSYALSFELALLEGQYEGTVDVYYTTDATAQTGLNKLISISEFTAVPQKISASLPLAEKGVYYVVFIARAPKDSQIAALRMDKFELIQSLDYDVHVAAITAPDKSKYEYSNQETVAVQLLNTGVNPTEGLKVALYVDDEFVAAEAVPAIPAGEEYEYVFTAKADLSTGSAGHIVKVLAVWDKDQKADNNEASVECVSTVVSPPYEVSAYENDYREYWTMVDGNKDKHTVEVVVSSGNDEMIYDVSDSPVASTDEYVYSRPLRLDEGKKYRIESRIYVEGNSENATYGVSMGIYKKSNENHFDLIDEMGNQECAGWTNFQYNITIHADGIYYVGYHITKDTGTDYGFRLPDFSIEETSEYDIAIVQAYLPGTQLSAYNSLPVGVRVFNNGIEPISEFKIKVYSESIDKEETFALDAPLKSQMGATVWMTEEILFAETEQITVEAVLDGDKVAGNNASVYSMERMPSIDIPVSIPFQRNNGWLTIDRDQSGSGFSYGYNGGYGISLSYDQKSDQLLSRSINMAAGKIYKVSFSLVANYASENVEIFDVYALNCATMEKSKITTLVAEADYYAAEADRYTGYFSVSADGEYVIVFEDLPIEEGTSQSATVNGSLVIEEAASVPDIELTAITIPVADAVFTDAETVTATYKNAGNEIFERLSFILSVGDTRYPALVRGPIAAGSEGEVSFTGVNLQEPGDYALTISAASYADLTPDNNMITKTIKSLPVIEMEVVSIDAPKSGALGAEESIVVTLRNNGKGSVVDVPVSYTVTDANNAAATPIVVNEIIDQPIPEGESLQYTFVTPVDLSGETTYDIMIAVDMEGDTNLENNTCITKVNSTQKHMDAGVTAILGPTDKFMTAEEHLVISVKNYGEVSLFDVPVTATVKKDEVAIGSVAGVVPEIAAGEIVDYSFDTAVDLSQGGEITVVAATAIENDANKENDSCTGVIYGLMVDCGVESIVSPEAECAAGEQEITVVIRNFGDLDIADVPVRFKTGNMPQTGLYSGTIAAGESVAYTFATKYNFREGRTYTLSVYTEYEGDMNIDNDMCEMEVNAVAGIEDLSDELVNVHAASDAIIVETDQINSVIDVYNMHGVHVSKRVVTDFRTVIGLTQGVYVVKINTLQGFIVRKVSVK